MSLSGPKDAFSDDEREEVRIINKKYELSRKVKKVQFDYQHQILNCYSKDDKTIINDIDNIIKYGLYEKPKILRNLLLLY